MVPQQRCNSDNGVHSPNHPVPLRLLASPRPTRAARHPSQTLLAKAFDRAKADSKCCESYKPRARRLRTATQRPATFANMAREGWRASKANEARR